ncbi:MAG: hypothetical protein HY064_08830 [Bacteroidetes bacterium]|nr:hypothetical protein [Bacteroidota bacterium]
MKKLNCVLPVFIFFLFAFRGTNKNIKSILFNDDSTLAKRILKYTVDISHFGRKEFYTWTTPEQIEALRGGEEILSRSISPKNGPSNYDLVLSDSIYDTIKTARLLRETRYAKKRFAWTSAWPTVMGWENEKYGDQLLKITLKDSAIIVAFTPYCDTIFRYEDCYGNKLDENFVLNHSERIAAVYFAGQKTGDKTGVRGTYGKPMRMHNVQIQYREYVICHEAMIVSLEYGTDKIKNEMQEEIGALSDLENYLIQPKNGNKFYYGYVGTNYCYSNYSPGSVYGSYSNSIAFTNDYYLFKAERMKAISAAMNKAFNDQKKQIGN